VRQRRSTSGLAWVGVATATLLLGHWAGYVLAYRQVRLRDIVLTQTGHSYLASVGKLAFVLLFLALAWLVSAACGRGTGTRPPARFLPVAAGLITIQLVGFSALEIVERIVAGAPVAEMFGHYTFVLGLFMQVVTALLGASIVLWLARTVTRVYLSVTSRRRHPRTPGPSARANTGTWFSLRHGLVGDIGVRGPPLPWGF
jgi:hypothetical protein